MKTYLGIGNRHKLRFQPALDEIFIMELGRFPQVVKDKIKSGPENWSPEDWEGFRDEA